MPVSKNPRPEAKHTDVLPNPPAKPTAKPRTPVVPDTHGQKDEQADDVPPEDYDSTLKPVYPASPADTATKNKRR